MSNGTKNEKELIHYHTMSLFMGRSRDYQKESIDWIKTSSQKSTWRSNNQFFNNLNIANSRILRRASGSFLLDAHQAVISGFMPQVTDLLVNRANSSVSNQAVSESDEDYRLGAFQILEKAGKIALVDQFNFHIKTLVSYAPQYRMAYLDSALSYLKDQSGKGHDVRIIQALEAGINYTASWIERRKSLGAKNLEISESNLNRMRALLNEFN